MPLPNQNLSFGQSVVVTATAEDASGNPGTYTGTKPTWSQPTGLTVIPASDGFSATITAATTPGVFQIDVKSQPVSFGPNVTNSFDITVQEVPATQLVFSFGTPA